MIKYAKIPDYNNLGEIAMYSHAYQFRHKHEACPPLFLIRAYELNQARVFKGYLYMDSDEFETLTITYEERVILERYIGIFELTNPNEFKDFIPNHMSERFYK